MATIDYEVHCVRRTLNAVAGVMISITFNDNLVHTRQWQLDNFWTTIRQARWIRDFMYHGYHLTFEVCMTFELNVIVIKLVEIIL